MKLAARRARLRLEHSSTPDPIADLTLCLGAGVAAREHDPDSLEHELGRIPVTHLWTR